mmetsp:Transcript_42425/g.82990  ORF Transcript_42425/g.82990 Transcript_42425/m.82990 type:complete len:216 (-) Transcript_42425:182-829(-)
MRGEHRYVLEEVGVDVRPKQIAHQQGSFLLVQPAAVKLAPHKCDILGLEHVSVHSDREIGLSEGGVCSVVLEVRAEKSNRPPHELAVRLRLCYHHKVPLIAEHGQQTHDSFAGAELESIVLGTAHDARHRSLLVLEVLHPYSKDLGGILLVEELEFDQIVELLRDAQLHHLIQPLLSTALGTHPPPRTAHRQSTDAHPGTPPGAFSQRRHPGPHH